MSEERYWQIIELARAASDACVAHQAQAIAWHLSNFPVADIIDFSVWTHTKMMEANRSSVLTAVEWIFAATGMPEVSGDSWEYFRAWLVARGRRQYADVLNDPDVLADFFTTADEFGNGEAIEYAAHRAYELRTGKCDAPDEMCGPSVVETWPADSLNEDRTAKELVVRFPKLTMKFGPPLFL